MQRRMLRLHLNMFSEVIRNEIVTCGDDKANDTSEARKAGDFKPHAGQHLGLHASQRGDA